MAKTAKTLSFFASSLLPDGSTLYLPACALTGNILEDVKAAVSPLPQEVAEGCKNSVMLTLQAGNAYSRGWSPQRTPNVDLRISFATWDAFCQKKLGVKPKSIGRGEELSTERLLLEVKDLASQKLIEIIGALPGAFKKKEPVKKPTKGRKPLGRKKKLALAEIESLSNDDLDDDGSQEQEDDELLEEADI